jgi:hypothetical protein
LLIKASNVSITGFLFLYLKSTIEFQLPDQHLQFYHPHG